MFMAYLYMLIGACSGRDVSHVGVYRGMEIGKVSWDC